MPGPPNRPAPTRPIAWLCAHLAPMRIARRKSRPVLEPVGRMGCAHTYHSGRVGVQSAMNSERLREIETICRATCGLPEEHRSGSLDQACRGDAAHRHELDTRLATADKTDSYLETPAIQLGSALLAAEGSTDLLKRGQLG